MNARHGLPQAALDPRAGGNRSATGPLRIAFVATSLPVGGAETLLLDLVRRLDRRRFQPRIVCLKQPGPLGEAIAGEFPVHARLLAHKYDARVLVRLRRLFRGERLDAVVTVGAGDKMFWGRLAARAAGVPVVLSALHSTGWPDGIGRLNRLLTPLTDGFIAVAAGHARHLIDEVGLPARKVFLIRNGIDTERFQFDLPGRRRVRAALGINDGAPLVAIVAALRPEKNHERFLRVAQRVHRELPESQFALVGDGPRRAELHALAAELGLAACVHFLGTRSDVPALLSACDLFALTSRNEASPVSLLEALACQRAVVAPDVGSVNETVRDGRTGRLVPVDDESAHAAAWRELLSDPLQRAALGAAGRRHVLATGSLESMAGGYERLVARLVWRKCGRRSPPAFPRPDDPAPAAAAAAEAAMDRAPR